MDNYLRLKRIALVLFVLTAVSFSSCTDTLESEVVVYSNDFSGSDISGFTNARLQVYEQDTVLGYYHNEEVSFTMDNLPSHNLLKITIEIYVHDSWDGNSPDGIGGPDLWFFGVDSQEVFRTSFSNTVCNFVYCLYQSFPDTYFRQNRPKSGAVQTNLPGICIFGAEPNYTAKYSISKIIEHSSRSSRIYMNTDLTAANSPNPVCDESWSLASVKVEALNLK